MNTGTLLVVKYVVSRGAVHSAASSYAAIRMVAGLRPMLVITGIRNWEFPFSPVVCAWNYWMKQMSANTFSA